MSVIFRNREYSELFSNIEDAHARSLRGGFTILTRQFTVFLAYIKEIFYKINYLYCLTSPLCVDGKFHDHFKNYHKQSLFKFV